MYDLEWRIRIIIKEVIETSYLNLNLSTLQEIADAAAKYEWVRWNEFDRASKLIRESWDYFAVYFREPGLLTHQQYYSLSDEVCLHAIKLLCPYTRKLFQKGESEMCWIARNKILKEYKNIEQLLSIMHGTLRQRGLFMEDATSKAFYKLKKAINILIMEFDVFQHYHNQLLCPGSPLP